MGQDEFGATRSEVAALLPGSFSHTLEIGCASGDFTRRRLGAASERWGVEPNAAAADSAAPHFTRMLVGTYDAIADELPDGYFDLVICNDVIEHMPDHDRFLQDIKRKMKPGGYIVGSIPNIRHFTALVRLLLLKDFKYTDVGIFDRTHLRFFTFKSLRDSFVRNGYVIERLQGIRSIIRSGILGTSGVKKIAGQAGAAALVGLSLGYWSDTQYPQFGFRVRRD